MTAPHKPGLGMTIHNLIDDGSVEFLLKGDGYSVAQEKDGPRARFDVWSGDVHRAVPFMLVDGESAMLRAPVALTKLRSDAVVHPVLRDAIDRLEAVVNG